MWCSLLIILMQAFGGRGRTKEDFAQSSQRAQRTALRGWAFRLRLRLQGDGPGWVRVRRRGLGLIGRQSARGDEEGFAVGAEARGLSGDVSGGRRGRRLRSEEDTSELQS